MIMAPIINVAIPLKAPKKYAEDKNLEKRVATLA